MAKTLNQLGEATDLDTPDLLLARDTSTGDDKRITLKNSRFSRHGLTESVTLSTGTLTIPVGMSTIKLPTSVWDGSSNITISAIAFEDGVQPAVGYEFSVVVPKTTTAGSLTAGALGNEVLIQDGASIAVEANNNADLPCYPNAADNPGTDPVQFAAPYYRLDFRVDSYDGSGNPVVSLIRLPDAVSGSNDRGTWERHANVRSICTRRGYLLDVNSAADGWMGRQNPEIAAPFSGNTNSCVIGNPDDHANDALFNLYNIYGGISCEGVSDDGTYIDDLSLKVVEGAPESGDQISVCFWASGEWY